MQGLIRELRRREVFRTAGLYVGIAWIAIEGASVLLPAFDAPDWVLRALIIAAVVGFPIAIVLAWIYDVTDKGIEVQGEPTDTVVVPFGGRKMDFIVIGVLSVALIFSVYMNLTSGPDTVESQEPVSVLIADFVNGTGDPLFDGTLEQALQIGIESAPFVTTFNRNTAKAVAAKLRSGSEQLDEEAARLGLAHATRVHVDAEAGEVLGVVVVAHGPRVVDELDAGPSSSRWNRAACWPRSPCWTTSNWCSK